MESCRKPSSVQLTQRLVYSNILGLDSALRNGRWIYALCMLNTIVQWSFCQKVYPFMISNFLQQPHPFLRSLNLMSTFAHCLFYLLSLKDGTLNMEMLQFKSKFPREVLLCRVCYYMLSHDVYIFNHLMQWYTVLLCIREKREEHFQPFWVVWYPTIHIKRRGNMKVVKSIKLCVSYCDCASYDLERYMIFW
jgi:hypothetical protein